MDMNQISVEVGNFHESVDFYQRLGFKLIVSARDEYARFELPSGSATFSIILSGTPNPGASVIYLEVDDVDGTYADLVAAGVTFESAPADQPYRWRTAPFKDPSGNTLCLYHAGLDRRFPPWRIEPDPAP
ncbi:MAG: VOC family protein [Pseudomonadota bacterium]